MRLLALCFITIVLAACSAIESAQNPQSDFEGLSYYMPKKDFVVTITTKSGQAPKVGFAESAAYPDLGRKYVLRYSRNLVGKNTMNVTANEKGLLSTATSDSVSGVADALKNLASAIGTVRGLGVRAALLPATCPDGDHVFVFPAETSTFPGVCGVTIDIEKVPGGDAGGGPTEGKVVAGIYYRQNEPYRVTASGGGTDIGTILFSPSNSATRLMPIFGTVFANNHAEFAFTDGMPTKYNVDTDGEAIALLKLPAEVLSAYFSAVGAVFDGFKAIDSKKAAELDAAIKLQLAQQKYDACVAAIKANDVAAIAKLGC